MRFRHIGFSGAAWLGLVALHGSASARTVDPFAFDPTFNGGGVIEDRFAATSTSTSQFAQKLVRLDNGDLVAAGIVQSAFSSATGAPGNLGLVRYGADGSRLAWSAPTPAFSYFNNVYVDYPNTSDAHFTRVRDIKTLAGFIYVLVDEAPGSDTDVYVVAFRDDGSFVDIYGAFATTLPETGVGLVPYSIPNCNGVLSCPMLIAVGNYQVSSDTLARHVVTAKRFAMGNAGPPTFNPNGTLGVDNSFGPFGNGADDYVAPDSSCTQEHSCTLVAAGVAAVRTNSANPLLYIGGHFDDTGQLKNTVVLGVDGNSGSLLGDFGDAGFKEIAMDVGNDSHVDDYAIGIAAEAGGGRASDEVYVVSFADMTCEPGIGVAKLRGVNGDLDPAFGTGGIQSFGGSNDFFCTGTQVSTAAKAVALQGDRLAIVGDTATFDVDTHALLDDSPSIGILRTTDGRISDFQTQTPLQPNGSPWRTMSYWNGVVADGTGAFAVIAALGDPNTNALLFGTARLVSEGIFDDGFD